MPQPNDALAVFGATAADRATSEEILLIPEWRREDWETLLACTKPMQVRAGGVLIQKDESARTLFLVVTGLLEVTAVPGDHGTATIAQVKPRSIVGELAFLDGRPRSAEVWAVRDTDLRRLEYQDYERFAREHPGLAGSFMFGVARLLAIRMRNTFANER